MSEKIIAYKAMNPDMTCRGKKYEVGKTYFEDKADCCNKGMHACENPFEVLCYYPMKDNPRFFEVECGGEISKSDKGSKLACTELTVKGELNFAGMLKATLDAVFRRVKNKEPFSSGYSNTAGTSGYYSTAASTGSHCRAKVEGDSSIAVANGYKSKAKGSVGCYLVLTEYDNNGNFFCADLKLVDGISIKADTWYMLKDGLVVESE